MDKAFSCENNDKVNFGVILKEGSNKTSQKQKYEGDEREGRLHSDAGRVEEMAMEIE